MDDLEVVKRDVNNIKLELNDIKEHCCSIKLMKESIEARVSTNIALNTISDKISLLEKSDGEIGTKIDNLYKALYIAVGGLIVFEALILPTVLKSLNTGGG